MQDQELLTMINGVLVDLVLVTQELCRRESKSKVGKKKRKKKRTLPQDLPFVPYQGEAIQVPALWETELGKQIEEQLNIVTDRGLAEKQAQGILDQFGEVNGE